MHLHVRYTIKKGKKEKKKHRNMTQKSEANV